MAGASLPIIAIIIMAFLVGVFVGIIVMQFFNRGESKVTAVMILSLIAFFGYALLMLTYGKTPSDGISIAIIAFGFGTKVGEATEKVLERVGSIANKGTKK